MEVYGGEGVDERKYKRPKSKGTTSMVMDDGPVAAMVRGHLS